MPERILIAGYYGWRNAGDEAILGGMLADLRQACPGAAFTVVSGDPDVTRQLHGVDVVSWADLAGLVEAVRRSSLIIVGGGGLFHDYWGVDPSSLLTSQQSGIAEYGAPLVLARLLGVPAMLYGVGVGPLFSDEARQLTRDLFALASTASVRDAASLHVLEQIGLERPAVTLAADPAFSLPEAALPEVLERFLGGLAPPVLGVALRPWSHGISQAGWEEAVAAALDQYLAAAGGTALFIPLQDGAAEVEDDVAVGRRVQAQMTEAARGRHAPDGLNPLERFRLLERCDAVLGMRMHALVAALRAGRPCVGLAYDPKVTALMEAAGLGAQALPPEQWEPGLIAERLRGADGVPGAGVGCLKEWRSRAGESARLAAKLLAGALPEPAPAEAALRRAALEKVLAVQSLGALARRLEGEVEARDGRLAAQAEDIRRLEGRIAEQAEEIETLRRRGEAELQALRQRMDEESASTRQAIAELQAERDRFGEQRAALAGELAALRDTFGVRLLAVYWAAARRLAPAGSPGRRLYARLRRMIAPRARSSAPLLERNARRIPAESASLDPGLQAFVTRACGSQPPMAVMILSPTQLIESEGQRSTHFARELARRGIPVIFGYWRWRTEERRLQDRLEEGIYQVPLDELIADAGRALSLFAQSRRLLLMEFPHPSFFGLLAAANGKGWVTVYEVVDDWEAFHSVGQAVWYDAGFEAHLMSAADAVTAVSPALVERVRRMSGREVERIPNGVSPGVATVTGSVPLERGGVTLGYFGHWTRAWFDWRLVSEVARRRPEWRLHLIGYGEEPPGGLPRNVILHGKVLHSALAAYASQWDVGIIPFKAGPVARAADPIKLYEYLAMGLPVVVSGVGAPPGTVGIVFEAEGAEAFVDAVQRAGSSLDGRAEERRAFAARCTWEERVGQLLAMVEAGSQRIAEKAALFGHRP
jgi:polysaccharide pyruvyl transferase CsaB